jgi:hypothetical protein
VKYRSDFVTNSSSCSYCVLGVTVEHIERVRGQPIKKIIYETIVKEWLEDGSLKDLCEDNDLNYDKYKNKSIPELIEVFEDELSDTWYDYEHSFDISYFDDMDEGHVGWAIESMKDDETLREFKYRVARAINARWRTGFTSKDLVLYHAEGYC